MKPHKFNVIVQYHPDQTSIISHGARTARGITQARKHGRDVAAMYPGCRVWLEPEFQTEPKIMMSKES